MATRLEIKDIDEIGRLDFTINPSLIVAKSVCDGSMTRLWALIGRTSARFNSDPTNHVAILIPER